MLVDTLASTRIADRVYNLEACKASFSGENGGDEKAGDVQYRVEVVEDRPGAGTHDRVIAAIHCCISRYEAFGVWRLVTEVALHHEQDPFS